MSTFPVGTQLAVYAADRTLVRRVGLDVDTGRLLEPLELAEGETLWIAFPDGPLLPFTGSFPESGTRPIRPEDIEPL